MFGYKGKTDSAKEIEIAEKSGSIQQTIRVKLRGNCKL